MLLQEHHFLQVCYSIQQLTVAFWVSTNSSEFLLGSLPSSRSLVPIRSKTSVYLRASFSRSVFGCLPSAAVQGLLCTLLAQPTSGEEQTPLACPFLEEVAPKAQSQPALAAFVSAAQPQPCYETHNLHSCDAGLCWLSHTDWKIVMVGSSQPENKKGKHRK